jgi:hypothetical protein
MVVLDSETPCFYWTFDDFEDLEHERTEYEFQDAVGKCNAIKPYAIGPSHVTCDSPEEWDQGDFPVPFDRHSDGRYEYHSEGVWYEGVRADTKPTWF